MQDVHAGVCVVALLVAAEVAQSLSAVVSRLLGRRPVSTTPAHAHADADVARSPASPGGLGGSVTFPTPLERVASLDAWFAHTAHTAHAQVRRDDAAASPLFGMAVPARGAASPTAEEVRAGFARTLSAVVQLRWLTWRARLQAEIVKCGSILNTSTGKSIKIGGATYNKLVLSGYVPDRIKGTLTPPSATGAASTAGASPAASSPAPLGAESGMKPRRLSGALARETPGVEAPAASPKGGVTSPRRRRG